MRARACTLAIGCISTIAFLTYHSGSAQAALIAYEGFEQYSSGPLAGNNQGTGWSGSQSAWAAVSGLNVGANNLSYNNGIVSVNGGNNVARVLVTSDSTSAASRSFAEQTGTVYFSFLFRANAGTVDANDFISFMMNNDATVTNSAGIGKPTNTNTFLGARIGTVNGGDTTNSSTTFLAGTTYFLVGSVSKVSGSTDYNRVQLYINPSSNIEPGTASATDNAAGGFSTISYFTLRTLTLDSDDDYQFDELRIGTTFASVVPIPEPSTWVIFTAGASLLFGWRRFAGKHA